LPTYQYLCTACDEPLEVVQGFNDARLTECPACGGRLRQVFSAVGVVFKGSGFYRNDSRGKTSTSDGGSSAPAAASGGETSASPAKAADSAASPAPAAAPATKSGGGDKVA
jgi:putative FmdB family regulatory protein